MLLRENHSVASLGFFISFFLIHSFLRFLFTQVRDECFNGWREYVTKMEESWNERYQYFKARYEEFFKNRVDLMATLVNSNVKNKKRKVINEEFFFTQVRDECCKEWTEVGKGRWKLETKMEKSWNQRYEDTRDSNQHLQEQLEKFKDSLKVNRVMKVLQISFQNSFFLCCCKLCK